MRINPQFETAGEFSDGRARVGYANRFGYIDTKGKLAINPQFDRAGEFEHGLAPVWSGNLQGYVNRDGKYVWMPTA